MVNEETEEAIVEVYLKAILIYPLPNAGLFRFTTPKNIIVSRSDSVTDLEKKI